MKIDLIGAALAALCLAGCSTAGHGARSANTVDMIDKPQIVLVHGAFADGSSWSKIIPLLQAKGYHVVSIQNPLTSLADDVAATNRVINQQKGPVVLVGHSWAGVVITEAGNNPKVDGLVYVDASAPDSGQSISDASAGWPPPPWVAEAVKDEGGFLYLPETTIARYFAQDLSPVDQRIIAATQGPWFSGCGTDKVTRAAWRDKPSWWVIGQNDHMIDPKLQEQMAVKINARITKLQTSHLAMLADPHAVTNVIVAAAEKVQSARSVRTSHTAGDDDINPTMTVHETAPADITGEAIRAGRRPAPVVPLSDEPPARLYIDPPLADSLAHGRVVIQYRAEHVRIVQVFGPHALDVSPRIGHIHVTVDDTPWHWLDASGEPITITGLPAGPHQIMIELVNANHQTLDYGVVRFDVPYRFLTKNDRHAEGFRSSPKQGETP